MLKPVYFIMYLVVTKPQERAGFNIIIYPMNIRIGMVNDIVFCLPHVLACAQKIRSIGSNIIDPFIGAETAVGAIMHYIESNSCCQAT